MHLAAALAFAAFASLLCGLVFSKFALQDNSSKLVFSKTNNTVELNGRYTLNL